jgi:phage/plasmid-like protein (TIGR03299 family)
MVAAIDTMAYAGQVPWHGLGFPVSNDLTPAEICAAAKIDWTVSKRQAFFQANDGTLKPADGEYVIVRDTDEAILSDAGSGYKPIQNVEAIDFMREFVTRGDMTMETAGALWGGKYVWALARISKDFDLVKPASRGRVRASDEVRGYLLIAIPHKRGLAMKLAVTPVRVVCWNTYSWALGSAGSAAFKVSHITQFDTSVKERAKEALGLATDEMAKFQEAATVLSVRKAAPDEVEQFFCEVLHFDPRTAIKNKDGSIREGQVIPRFRAALEHAPGQMIATAAGTWWGAFNAVTYVVDHENGRDRDSGLKNAWFGHQAGVKQRAFELACTKAGVSGGA